MKIFKFGGASVKNAEAVRNVAKILSHFKEDKILMIVSAMGKTTNALEAICESQYYDKEGKEEVLNESTDFHMNICDGLGLGKHSVRKEIEDDWNAIPQLVEQYKDRDYDFIYDQVISLGEWASTKIVSAYLNEQNIDNKWLESMHCVKTDNTYKEGKVNWEKTLKCCKKEIQPLLKNINIVVTQGFTGESKEGFTTTLGREGSDYSAAIFSYCLDAESMTVWKDVPGILNADPRKFKNVSKLDKISYREAAEMTYYGAKVIHPKTIKPLQNKNIPLLVKSFIDPDGEGTIISSLAEETYPPIVVVESNQNLLHISTRDFSFIAEEHLSHLFASFAKYRIKVNMMRNTAISFYVCVSHKSDRLNQLIEKLQKDFNIERTIDLELITVRYYNDEVISKLKEGKIVLLEERLKNTAQMVVKNVPVPERITEI
ncbi:MAG: aspartate kinase [Maribacter sp.]|jgi:aspartate kinase